MLRSVSWVIGTALVSPMVCTNTFIRPLWGAENRIISPLGEIRYWFRSGSLKNSSMATGSAGVSSGVFAGDVQAERTARAIAVRRMSFKLLLIWFSRFKGDCRCLTHQCVSGKRFFNWQTIFNLYGCPKRKHLKQTSSFYPINRIPKLWYPRLIICLLLLAYGFYNCPRPPPPFPAAILPSALSNIKTP